MLGIQEEKIVTEGEIEREKIHRSRVRDLFKEEDSIFPYLTAQLDRVDNKVSALLTFNGIGIAILTIFATSYSFLKDGSFIELLAISISGICLIVSCYICLTLLYLYGYHSGEGYEYERKIIFLQKKKKKKI